MRPKPFEELLSLLPSKLARTNPHQILQTRVGNSAGRASVKPRPCAKPPLALSRVWHTPQQDGKDPLGSERHIVMYVTVALLSPSAWVKKASSPFPQDAKPYKHACLRQGWNGPFGMAASYLLESTASPSADSLSRPPVLALLPFTLADTQRVDMQNLWVLVI